MYVTDKFWVGTGYWSISRIGCIISLPTDICRVFFIRIPTRVNLPTSTPDLPHPLLYLYCGYHSIKKEE